eukprot:6050-Heterococcus_DN1.PRE.6
MLFATMFGIDDVRAAAGLLCSTSPTCDTPGQQSTPCSMSVSLQMPSQRCIHPMTLESAAAAAAAHSRMLSNTLPRCSYAHACNSSASNYSM